MNVVLLSGRVVRDSETFEIGSRKKTVFTIATKEPGYYDQQNNHVETTEFLQIEQWSGRQYKKGDFLELSGKVRNDSWEKDGQKHWKTYVLASSVIRIQKSTTSELPVETAAGDSDLPF